MRARVGGYLTAACLSMVVCGCATPMVHPVHQQVTDIAYSDVPRELNKVTLPTYRVEPPDILLISAVSSARSASSPLRTGDQLLVQIANGLPLVADSDPDLNPLEYQAELSLDVQFKLINRDFMVGNDGTLDLGPAYGQIPVEGLSLDEARAAIDRHLREVVGLANPVVAVRLLDIGAPQPVAGEHLVRPDGTVSLGVYGEIPVAGLTLSDVKLAVEHHLSRYLHRPEVSVDVLAYNSKVYYVVTDFGGLGQQVVRFPVTGNETVLDAISQIEGLSSSSSKKVWIARPGPAGSTHSQILDVHWEEIVAEGITTTNYQILPGDRVYVEADWLIATDNLLSKIFAPLERTFGVITLGSGTVRTLKFFDQQGGAGGVGF
ncbi:polysaccharide biosynthesis/export family protein [Maioricimonas sp. JC845]|uniref:polysaccharide biosynthesis/export family protein n=1 Tax=Maioricimonas sp. JC845 TaxID=3232138 RepID=UPI0034584068